MRKLFPSLAALVFTVLFCVLNVTASHVSVVYADPHTAMFEADAPERSSASDIAPGDAGIYLWEAVVRAWSALDWQSVGKFAEIYMDNGKHALSDTRPHIDADDGDTALGNRKDNHRHRYFCSRQAPVAHTAPAPFPPSVLLLSGGMLWLVAFVRIKLDMAPSMTICRKRSGPDQGR